MYADISIYGSYATSDSVHGQDSDRQLTDKIDKIQLTARTVKQKRQDCNMQPLSLSLAFICSELVYF